MPFCRAALKLFERHLDPAVAGQYDAQLRQFGLVFGAARDWDVFCLQTLPAAVTDLPAQRIWDLHPVAEVERQAAHAMVGAALRGPELCRQPSENESERLLENRRPFRLRMSEMDHFRPKSCRPDDVRVYPRKRPECRHRWRSVSCQEETLKGSKLQTPSNP